MQCREDICERCKQPADTVMCDIEGSGYALVCKPCKIAIELNDACEELPFLYRSVDIADVQDEPAATRAASDWARAICVNANPASRTLFLFGPSGNGKTMLASATARAILASCPSRMRRGFRFANMADLQMEVDDSWTHKEARAEALRPYQHASLLVIDDVGATAKGTAELYFLMNFRVENAKFTIVTSNLSIKNIKETLDARLADRFCRNGALVVELLGASRPLAAARASAITAATQRTA